MYIKALECYDKKDFDSSSVFINQCLKCDKNFYQAQFLKAKIYFFQSRYDEAEEIFYDLAKKYKESYDIQTYLIQCLIFNGKYDKATRKIEDLLRQNRGDWRLYYYASLVAAKKGELERRMQMLDAAEKALGSSAKVYSDLAFVWECLGVAQKSQEYGEKHDAIANKN
ncbi:MAG: tetratricopeptide repeat protein [Treponemataceae bacterium]|nr:tetratricopeptide repeat protein [Treponemataceae bacterium]